MSYGHTSYNGYPQIKTQAFDKIANEGIYFNRAYTSSPSCSPSRASVLTGRNAFELEEGAVLFSYLPKKFIVYPEILSQNGYLTGFTGKGWGPGDIAASERTINPAGKEYNTIKTKVTFPFGEVSDISKIDYFRNFKKFLGERSNEQPFCFWFGATEPHRDYQKDVGVLAGKDPSQVIVPGFFPDNEVVKKDILDYLFEIEWYDAQLLKMMSHLDSIGELDNTIVVMTSDNGMPFPRAKSNLYEYGIHLPLAIRWGKNEPRIIDDFISFADFAPTFLEAAKIPIPETMSGKSFYDILKSKKSGQINPDRNNVLVYKERHAWSQLNGKCIPTRGYRKDNWLAIWNIAVDMWPAGDPDPEISFIMWPFSDADEGPTKNDVMRFKHIDGEVEYFDLAYGKRPEFELYDVVKDPFQLNNLAADKQYTPTLTALIAEMKAKLLLHNDPRMTGKGIEHFQNAPYFGRKAIETGWSAPINWNPMTQEQRNALIIKRHAEIEENKLKIKKIYGEE
jgi:uncharacterized sulfatase